MPAQPVPARSPRRTRAEQAEFYDQLVQTSLRLFAEGGYEAITMRRLAGEAGMPPMSLYRYFPTKAHLMRHIWDHVFELALARALRAVRASDPATKRLRAYVGGFLDYWLEHREHYWIVFAIRESAVAPHAEHERPLGPDAGAITRKLGDLYDACLGKHRPPDAQRRVELDLVFCKMLGFLLGPIGLPGTEWGELKRLKAQLLDDIEAQVRCAAAGSARASDSRARP